jgi:cellulose synthase/poly-beta-1,6-N-acetylglucosamine synthase-like glycosyltransferase
MTTLAIVIFVSSAGGVLYVLFGYPLLLGWMARLRQRTVEKRLERRTVSVLLPVRNGAAHIHRKLRSIRNLEYPQDLLQVIVVDDGSDDETAQLARRADPAAQVFSIPPAGKATALNFAMQRATGEIFLFTDVRQDLAPDSLALLVACFADPSVGAVSGKLVIRKGQDLEEASVGLYWRYEAWIRQHLSRVDSILGATGCLYAMRRDLTTSLPPDTLADDVYQPLNAFFRGYRVILEETARAFDYPTNLPSEFRRKVRTLAGVYQIMRAYPALLGPRNRMWFHFVSHKLARLCMPFALILLAISSFGLPSPWSTLMISGQAVFYLLALLDLLLPQRLALRRLTAPVRTFVTLMVAALCAPFALLAPRRLWRPTDAMGSHQSV